MEGLMRLVLPEIPLLGSPGGLLEDSTRALRMAFKEASWPWPEETALRMMAPSTKMMMAPKIASSVAACAEQRRSTCPLKIHRPDRPVCNCYVVPTNGCYHYERWYCSAS